MRTFDYSKLNCTIDNEIMGYIAKIHEFKGRQQLLIASRIVRNFFEKSHANQAAFCSLSHSIFCSRRVSALM